MNPEQDERLGLSSASSAEADHFCSGRRNLIASLPKESLSIETTEVATSGSRIHAALESRDVSDLDMTEAEIAERCNELEREVLLQWLQDRCGGMSTSELVTVRETRMWIFDADLKPIRSAKLDVAFIMGSKAAAVDFKTGFLPATVASRNFQMKTQAVALSSEHNVDEVRVAVAQHRFKSILSQSDYDKPALENAYAEILHDTWKSAQADAPRTAGCWCTYCPARSACVEFASYSLLPSVVTQRLLPVAPDKKDVAAAVEQLLLEDLAMIQKRSTLISNLLEAVKARLKKLPAEELTRLGFELSDGRPQMEVKDAGAVVEYLEAQGLLKEDEVMDCFKLLNGNLEELILPRIVANPEYKITNQKDAKAFLRGRLSSEGWINYEASRTEGSLKAI